ncbi:MAG: TauD/TfdA family dioxygenase [Rhodospirillales bacterium]
MTPEIAEAVNAALIKWKVIFFKGQNLSHAGQVSFARSMGEPTIGHAVFGHDPDYPEIYSVAKFRTAQTHRTAKMQRPWTGWHTDLTAAINPPKASILRGVTIPPYGGDTFWTNLAAAYEGLSETFRNFVDTLKGIHRFEPPAGAKMNSNYDESIRHRVMESEHPLVRIHPESGERILFVSPSFLKSVSGLTPRESGQILELLWEHITRPEYTVRFKWEPGDIAMWDNRSTAHLAPTDIFESDYDRQLYRVTLVGDVPVGTDGEQSISLQGQPILSVQDELALQAVKGR